MKATIWHSERQLQHHHIVEELITSTLWVQQREDCAGCNIQYATMVCNQLIHAPLKLTSTPPSLSLYFGGAIVFAVVEALEVKGDSASGSRRHPMTGGWDESSLRQSYPW